MATQAYQAPAEDEEDADETKDDEDIHNASTLAYNVDEEDKDKVSSPGSYFIKLGRYWVSQKSMV